MYQKKSRSRTKKKVEDRRIVKARRQTSKTPDRQEFRPGVSSTPTKIYTYSTDNNQDIFSPIRKQKKLNPTIVDNPASKPNLP